MSKLTLDSVEWQEFFIGGINGIFDVSGTKTTHPNDLKKGGIIPRVTCAATNNAIDDFYQNEPTEIGGVLTIDSATDGYVSYQLNDFIATDHVEKIMGKTGKINKYIGLFLKTAIDKSKLGKYSYGYKFSQKRIIRQKIKLPIDNNGNPNWQFMEDYIKQEMKEQSQKIVDYYENKLLKLGFNLLDLEVEWKEFFFTDIFKEVKRGKRLTKANQKEGDIPYVSSTALNNGIDNFISNNKGVRKYKNNLSIANSGSVGSCFYHKYEYIASDHITTLTCKNADENIYKFMSTIIKRLESKYSFNREINDTRISREKLILPIDKDGNPHWEYMSKFIQNLEVKSIKNIVQYIYIYIYTNKGKIERI